MANPRVREVGRLDDFHGARLVVGVDYDTVTIGYGHTVWCIDADKISDLIDLLRAAAVATLLPGNDDE